MVLQMPSPIKHPKTGVYWLKVRVPSDLVGLVGTKTISRTLSTKDPAAAKVAFTATLGDLQREWKALRSESVRLTHKQVVALSGERYKFWAGLWSDDPPSELEALQRMAKDVGARDDRLEVWYGRAADALLRAEGIKTDEDSRLRLMREIHRAEMQALEGLIRNAGGDYTPDPAANRFPDWSAVRPQEVVEGPVVVDAPEVTLTALFGLWERDHLANGKSPRTVGDFRQKVASLIAFLGHEDALKVTPEAIADWCDHLRHKQGLAAKTVSQKYLAVIKVVLGVAVEKRKLKENPAKENKVRYGRAQRSRPKGFTDEEAMAILTAALADPATLGKRTVENKRAIHWGPWICAFTGARITEVMQMRTDDLITEQGVTCLRITPEAGSVKTGKYRIVPIHPQLIEMGLPAMIRALPAGPVFYSLAPIRGKPADPVERAQSAGAKVGQWVRDVVGIADPAVQPNHAWRHRFKTVAREANIDVEVRDAIQGHEDGRAASGYGEVTVKAMWAAIQELPRFPVKSKAE